MSHLSKNDNIYFSVNDRHYQNVIAKSCYRSKQFSRMLSGEYQAMPRILSFHFTHLFLYIFTVTSTRTLSDSKKTWISVLCKTQNKAIFKMYRKIIVENKMTIFLPKFQWSDYYLCDYSSELSTPRRCLFIIFDFVSCPEQCQTDCIGAINMFWLHEWIHEYINFNCHPISKYYRSLT